MATTPSGSRTADSDSLPVFGGGTRDIELILWDMAQARYIEESARARADRSKRRCASACR